VNIECKGSMLDFLKVVGKRISRKNNNRGRRKAWESARWWECALAIVATICCPSFLSAPPLPVTPSEQSMKSYLDCTCYFY